MDNKIKSVLFVCTANRYRSPFAEAVFKRQLDADGVADDWQVSSAGTWTKDNLRAMPAIVRKAQEFKLNLEEHRSTEISQELLLKNNLVIVMEKGHKEALCTEFQGVNERILLLSEIVDGIAYDIPDPVKAMDEADQIINELYVLLQRGHDAICAAVNDLS